MSNDPGASGALPSRGFASILTLVSDVSQELEAVKQAREPASPPVAPRPVRVEPMPSTGPVFSSEQEESTPWWKYGLVALVAVQMLRCLAA